MFAPSALLSHVVLATVLVPRASISSLFLIKLLGSLAHMELPPASQPRGPPGRYSSVVCFSCNLVNTSKRSIQCAQCQKHAHLTCVNLTRRQADGISHWHCRSCLGRAPTSNPNSSPNPNITPSFTEWGRTLREPQTKYSGHKTDTKISTDRFG